MKAVWYSPAVAAQRPEFSALPEPGPSKVVVNGVKYVSVAEAARKLRCSPTRIRRMVRECRK